MNTTPVFDRVVSAVNMHPRYVDCGGGTRSGKTYAIMQVLILLANYEERPTTTSVVSESLPHLRRGAMKDFREIMEGEGLWDASRWNASRCVYEFENGSLVEFFGVESAAKVHGSRRHRIFINEAQNVRWEVARQLFVRTTDMVFYDYNPVRVFWAHEKIQPREDCVTIRSTYRDNKYLTHHQQVEIENNRDDVAWWRVYGEGEVGQALECVLPFDVGDRTRTDGFIHLWGLDFGYTFDPTAVVEIYAHSGKRKAYVAERLYEKGLTNDKLAARLFDVGYCKGDILYADAAEPKSIDELRLTGINAFACDKSAPVHSERVAYQLNWLRGWDLTVSARSLNLIDELRGYRFRQLPTGESTNTPAPSSDHLIDAMRYALWTHFSGNNQTFGKYVINFN